MKKFQSEKGAISIVVIAIAAVIVLGAGYGAYRTFGQKLTSSPATPTTPKAEADFVEQGVTIETCQFFYERPEALALTADLIFVETSMCDVGNGEQLCAKVDTSILRGQSTKIEGHVEQVKKVQVMGPASAAQSFPSVITVHKLTILKEIVPTEFGGEACVPSKEYTNP